LFGFPLTPWAVAIIRGSIWLRIGVPFESNTIQLHAVQYNDVECSMVLHGTAQWSTIQHPYSTAQHSQYSTVQFNTVEYSTAQDSTVQHSATALRDIRVP